MLAKEYRINQSRDYNNIYKNGKKVPGRYIIVYILENGLGFNRYGVVTSKKIGNAVNRNKIKRQLRAIIKNNLDKIKTSHDIVIVGRHKIGGTEYDLLENDYRIVMRKSGLWCEN